MEPTCRLRHQQTPSVVNYDPANNLNQYPEVDATPYSYNNNGCLTGGLLTSAAFDELNRLTQAVTGGVTNEYWNDPLNRQGQKAVDSVKTGFLYDGQQLIEEYDDNGDLAFRYIRGNRLDEIFIKIAGSTKTYLHHDRLGSVIAQTNSSGAVLNSYMYSPFGETSSLSGTPFGFTGQRYDEEMGLYYYRARIYAPAIGRFLQPDPIGFDAGDLNLYSYVGNDAANLTDSLGLMPGAGGNDKPQGSLLDNVRFSDSAAGTASGAEPAPKLKTRPGVLGPGSAFAGYIPPPQGPGLFPTVPEANPFKVQIPDSNPGIFPIPLTPFSPVPSFTTPEYGYQYGPQPTLSDFGQIIVPESSGPSAPADPGWWHATPYTYQQYMNQQRYKLGSF